MQLLKAITILGAVLPSALAAPLVGSQTGESSSGCKKYIVVLKETTSTQQLERHTIWAKDIYARNIKKRQELGEEVEVELEGVDKTFNINRFKAYSGAFDSLTLKELNESDDVQFIEEDHPAYLEELVTQAPAPWGLSEISNLASNASQYRYDDSAGEGQYVYVIDSGININHTDFEGRAEIGYNAFKNVDNVDSSGHGTHVSAIVNGKKFGVAKKARVINVKVFNAKNSSATIVMDGFDWAVNDIKEKNRENNAVINMSLTTRWSAAINMAVNNAWEDGILVVAAAGNYDKPASEYSPASASKTLTVGAVSPGHIRGRYSNYGSAVKIMAPGTNVTSAGIVDNDAERRTTGTSQAAPHVAGLICYLRTMDGVKTAQDTLDRLFTLARNGILDEADLKESPNILAYNGNGL